MALAECNYSIHNKEMLAIVQSLAEWQPELQGTAKCIQIFTDHKALKYFMTTKQLTGCQARWAEALSEYHFVIMYCTSKENAKADALTWHNNEVGLQDGLKTKYCTRAFLSQDQVDPQVLWDLGIDMDKFDLEDEFLLAPIKESLFDESIGLLDWVLQNNWQALSLEALCKQALREDSEITLEDRLLLYSGHLVVPSVML